MSPTIIGVGTATPVHNTSQDDSLKMFQDIVCETDRQRRLARALFRKSGVKNRHFVVPYKAAYTWCVPAEAVGVGADHDSILPRLAAPEHLPDIVPGESQGPTTAERMAMYRHFASDLATESASNALEDSGIAPDQITHLVVVTCTGFDSPGVDIELIKRLGLPATTQRVNVGFMGCHAAINGIRTANAIAASDPQANVLVCCVELCSLHYRFRWDSEGIIGNALFADGSASLVIGQVDSDEDTTTKPERRAHWDIVDTGSVVIPESTASMSWTVGDHGFEMMLASEVGDKIEEHLAAWLRGWLAQHGLAQEDIDYWGVHPGGPRILNAVEASLGLREASLATSRGVLRDHGNMSSPTVLFILQQFQQQHLQTGNDSTSNCLLLAFGPGLVAEAALISIGAE